MIAWLRSLLFALVFYGGSVIIVTLGVPFAFSQRTLIPYAHAWARFHNWCVRWLLGIRLQVHGTVPRGAVLLAAKHQSMFETVALVGLLDRPVIVLKAELTRIALWGWMAQVYGMIPIDREGSTAALRAMLKATEAARASGRPVVIFPEGTRVPPGTAPPVRAGFAGLYRHLGLPTVTLALDSGRVWPRHRFVKRSGTIHFRFGDPIPPGLPRREIEAIVHAGINLDPATGTPGV